MMHEDPPLSDRPSEPTRRPGRGLALWSPPDADPTGTPPALWAGEPSGRRVEVGGLEDGPLSLREGGGVQGGGVEGVAEPSSSSDIALPLPPF